MKVLRLKCAKCGLEQKFTGTTADAVMKKFNNSGWDYEHKPGEILNLCPDCAGWLSGEEIADIFNGFSSAN